MPKSSHKGSRFEREFCKQLSLWWTKGNWDDRFWRSSQSGGRATQRAKSGKTTSGHYGDIIGCTEDAQKLMQLITIELKCGYSNETPLDHIDATEKMVDQTWPKWIQQAIESAENAGTIHWWLVTKRDRKLPLLTMSTEMDAIINEVADSYGHVFHPVPATVIYWDSNLSTITHPLHLFWKTVRPGWIDQIPLM